MTTYEPAYDPIEPWMRPLVTSSPWGDVVLEWWHDARKITVYLSSRGFIVVCKVSGPNIDTDMSVTNDFNAAWNWLCYEPRYRPSNEP